MYWGGGKLQREFALLINEKLMRNMYCNILSWLPCLLLCSFRLESLFKYDAISCPRCFASSCVRFSSNSYSNMMQYPLLAARLAALPLSVSVPYRIFIQIWCDIHFFAALPTPVLVSYWSPVQIWCNILSWLLESLFEYLAWPRVAWRNFLVIFWRNMQMHARRWHWTLSPRWLRAVLAIRRKKRPAQRGDDTNKFMIGRRSGRKRRADQQSAGCKPPTPS